MLDDELPKRKVKHFTKSSSKNIMQTILLLVGLILIAYGIYTMFPNINSKEIRSISYETAIELYTYVDEVYPSSPFHDETVTIKDINENVLFSQILKILKYDKKSYETENCTNLETPCFIGEIDKSYLDTEISKRYNTILTGNTYFYNGIECKLDNDKYLCNLSLKTISTINVNLSMVYDYKTEDNKLEIYDLYLNYSSDGTCYLDNSKKYLCDNTFKDNMNKKNMVELLNQYGRAYKHTFIKENDSYYWYSSEMIKEAK